MRRDSRGRRFGLLSLAVLVLLVSPAASCKKEEPAKERRQAQGVINPYSSDSVFFEVKKQLEKNPDDADAWLHLADLYDRNGQYAEAVEAYKKVIALKPGKGYIYFKMGTAYDRMARPSDAVAAFKKAIQHMPGYAVAYNNLGIAYGKLGRRDEQIGALKKAIQLRPGYSTARYNLGIAYLRAGNKKAALQQYESLKDTDSGVAEALQKEIKGGS